MNRKVYAVRVDGAMFSHISQECYTTLKKAQAFIESRADKLVKMSPTWYKSSEEYKEYFIIELDVK